MRAPYLQVLICLQWCYAPASGAVSPEHLGDEEKGALGAALDFEGSVLVECELYSKEDLVHCIRLPVDSVRLNSFVFMFCCLTTYTAPVTHHSPTSKSKGSPYIYREHKITLDREGDKVLHPGWASVFEKPDDLLVTVDCTADNEKCQELAPNSSPAIHLYQDGIEVARYNGPRRAAA